jgi:flagellar protein FliL
MAGAKEAAAPRKKGKLLVIVAATLALVSGGGGAAWYFVRGKAADKPAETTKKILPVFLPLEPFVVNLTGSENYLQVGVVYAVESNDIAEAIKAHLPAAELTSLEGKQKLTAEILEDAKTSLADAQKKSVLDMHFSAFVIQ